MKYDTWKQYSCMHFDIWETAFSIIIIYIIQLDLVRQQRDCWEIKLKIIHMHVATCNCVKLHLYSVVLLQLLYLKLSGYKWSPKTPSRPSFNSKGYPPQYWDLWASKPLPLYLTPPESNFITLVHRVCTCSLSIIGIYSMLYKVNIIHSRLNYSTCWISS